MTEPTERQVLEAKAIDLVTRRAAEGTDPSTHEAEVSDLLAAMKARAARGIMSQD